MKTQFEQHQLDEMRKNPDNYKWWFFYFNPRDIKINFTQKKSMDGMDFKFCKSLLLPDNIRYNDIRYYNRKS